MLINVRLIRLKTNKSKRKKPIIEFEGKRYIFSYNSLLIMVIGTPILSYLTYLFFDQPFNYWLHEIVVKQTVFFLNLIFNMGASYYYYPGSLYPWSFVIPDRGSIFFETFCTGVQAIAVFAGIIICTPHSQDPKTNEDMIWRKAKCLVVSSAIFYVVNIIRMLIQLYLYYIGYAWEDIHYSISAASSFIAIIIVLLLHKWNPEFIISIIYIGTLVSEPMKERRNEKIMDQLRTEKKVELSLLKKALRMKPITFNKTLIGWKEKYLISYDDCYLALDSTKEGLFIEFIEKQLKSVKGLEIQNKR